MDIRDMQFEVVMWADETFPNREFKTTAAKLVMEEIPEWIKNPDDPHEYADILILVLDLAHMKDIDVARAFKEKMGINKSRDWEKDSTGLFYRHRNEHS